MFDSLQGLGSHAVPLDQAFQVVPGVLQVPFFQLDPLNQVNPGTKNDLRC